MILCFGPVHHQLLYVALGNTKLAPKHSKKHKTFTPFLGWWLSLNCPSDLFPYCGSDAAEHFAYGLKERVAERVDADGIDTANTLDLNQVAPYAWHHRPDVQEWQNGKVDAPDESHRNTKDCWQ